MCRDVHERLRLSAGVGRINARAAVIAFHTVTRREDGQVRGAIVSIGDVGGAW